MDNNNKVETLPSSIDDNLDPNHHQQQQQQSVQTTMMTNSSIQSSSTTPMSTTYLVPSVYPPTIADSGISAPISSYQISAYNPPPPPPPPLNESQNSNNDANYFSTETYQMPTAYANNLNPPTNVIPEQEQKTSMFLPPPPPPSQPAIYYSDGVIYPGELSNSNNVITTNDDDDDDEDDDEIQDVVLSNELVDLYNNLGIVGKILAGGSLVTIRFLQMFRNISETLVDALGIAQPKYQQELQAYEEMKQEEQRREAEREQLYAGWKPNVPSSLPLPPQIPTSYLPPSYHHHHNQQQQQQPAMSSDNIQSSESPILPPPPPPTTTMTSNSSFVTDSTVNLPNS